MTNITFIVETASSKKQSVQLINTMTTKMPVSLQNQSLIQRYSFRNGLNFSIANTCKYKLGYMIQTVSYFILFSYHSFCNIGFYEIVGQFTKNTSYIIRKRAWQEIISHPERYSQVGQRVYDYARDHVKKWPAGKTEVFAVANSLAINIRIHTVKGII